MKPFQSPAHREELVVRAARWMWDKNNSVTGIWWNPAVLTALNAQDSTNPHMTMEEAEAVFEVLKERDLLVSIPVTYIDQGTSILGTGYKFNTARMSEWTALIRKKDWFSLWLRPWAEEIWGKKRTAVWAFIYALILAFFVKIVEHIVDVLWRHFIG